MFWYFVINALDAVLTLVLAVVVIVKTKSRPVGYALAAWLFSVSIWSYGVAMHALATDGSAALFWSRFLHFGAVPLPLLYLHFTLTLLGLRKNRLIAAVSIPTLIFMLLIGTRWFIRDVSPVGLFSHFPKAGPIYPLYVAMFSMTVLTSFYYYATALNKLQGIERNRVKYVFCGSAIGFAGGATAFLPEFNVAVFPFGTPWVVLNAALITFAILKYRLMDIAVIIRKTLIYSVVTVTLTAVYLIVITLFARLFAGLTGYQTVFSSTVAVVLISSCFQPLRKKVQEFVDAKFFRSYVDREEKLYELSREVITHTTTEAMAQSLMNVLTDTLHPKVGALYLRAHDNSGFELVSYRGDITLSPNMSESNALAAYFADHPQPFVQQDAQSAPGQSMNTRKPSRKDDAA